MIVEGMLVSILSPGAILDVNALRRFLTGIEEGGATASCFISCNGIGVGGFRRGRYASGNGFLCRRFLAMAWHQYPVQRGGSVAMGEAVTSGPGGTITSSGSVHSHWLCEWCRVCCQYNGNRQWFFCHGYANAGILQATATPEFCDRSKCPATATNTSPFGSSV